MVDALNIYFTTLFAESGTLIVLFLLTGIAFNIFSEIIKKQIFPKYTAEELSAGKVQKDCPRWLGMIFGLVLTIVFLACAIGANFTNTPHCRLIGGVFFLPVWAVAYYIWQMAAMKLIKLIMKKMFPVFMTGSRPPRKPKTKVIRVPQGYKVEYEDEITGDDMNE